MALEGGCEMSDEEINIAIAEACGWEKKFYDYSDIPDYCNDLNAMHEAEKTLTRDQIEIFCCRLLPKHHGIWWGIHTTARQRAEAFLKAIGKWEEMECESCQ
jgi:hypothetical protein